MHLEEVWHFKIFQDTISQCSSPCSFRWPMYILNPSSTCMSVVLILMFILPEDWILHLQTSWKSMQHWWPQSDLIYKHNPHSHLDIAPMAAVPWLQAPQPFVMGLTGCYIWGWRLVTGGLSITSATQITHGWIVLRVTWKTWRYFYFQAEATGDRCECVYRGVGIAHLRASVFVRLKSPKFPNSSVCGYSSYEKYHPGGCMHGAEESILLHTRHHAVR